MNKIRVVVADDHSFIRYSISRILNQNNHIQVVAEAKDGAEALERVDEHQPDILLLDLEMPVMSGIEVARRLAGKSRLTRVIVISNYTDRGLVEEMMALGLHGYLSKEVVPQCLIPTVEAVFQGSDDFQPIVQLEAA